MNRCNEYFIKQRSIDFSRIDSNVYDINEINEIVEKYEVQGKTVLKNVSLAQIYGIYKRDSSIFGSFPEVLDSFFDANGSGYHSRSVSMLKYNEENIISGLAHSFQREPIVLIEVDNDNYLVFTNGNHRFLIMRILYLNAKSKCNSKAELEELNRRYSIPVEVVPVDLLKTYCKYLIDLFQPISTMNRYYSSIEEIDVIDGKRMYQLKESTGWDSFVFRYYNEDEIELLLSSYCSLESEYDSNYKKTGRSILIKCNQEKYVLTDEELILLTREIIINSDKKTPDVFDRLRAQAQKYDSFNEFLKKHFIDLLDFQKEEVKDGSFKTK